MEQAGLAERAMRQKLLMEHEMGELFKVIGWSAARPGKRWGSLRATAPIHCDAPHHDPLAHRHLPGAVADQLVHAAAAQAGFGQACRVTSASGCLAANGSSRWPTVVLSFIASLISLVV
jgi:hypothetical protein